MRTQTPSYVVSVKLRLPETVENHLEKSFHITNSAYNEVLSFGLRRFETLKQNSTYQELLETRRVLLQKPKREQKTAPTGFLNAKKLPMKAHENILVFYKKLPTYNPQMTQGHPRKVSSKASREKSVERQKLKVGSKDSNYNFYGESQVDCNSTERYPLRVQVFAKDQQKENYHPTQKPIALLEWLIKTYTNEGDLVLDNCMGSGSTGVACVNTNRDFIGFELTEQYFEVAKERKNR